MCSFDVFRIAVIYLNQAIALNRLFITLQVDKLNVLDVVIDNVYNHHLIVDTTKGEMVLFIKNGPSLVCMVMISITILSLDEFANAMLHSASCTRCNRKIPGNLGLAAGIFGRDIGKYIGTA